MPDAAALPGPTAPGVPCARCGSFQPPGALAQIGPLQLCPACVERAKSTRLFSSTAVTAVGVLLNPTASAAMQAINHSRLGDRPRARAWALTAVGLGAVNFALLALPIPGVAVTGAGLAIAIAITRGWAAEYRPLKALGFARANAWWAVLVTVGAVVAASLAVGVLFPG